MPLDYYISLHIHCYKYNTNMPQQSFIINSPFGRGEKCNLAAELPGLNLFLLNKLDFFHVQRNALRITKKKSKVTKVCSREVNMHYRKEKAFQIFSIAVLSRCAKECKVLLIHGDLDYVLTLSHLYLILKQYSEFLSLKSDRYHPFKFSGQHKL